MSQTTTTKTEQNPTTARRGERGAALITALLLSTLLLVAGGALVLTTSVGTSTAIDASTEARAYYAAEAGLQAALSVLRGNVPARAGHTPPPGTKMKNNLRGANTLAISNITGDAAIAAGTSRLSGYLPYSGTAVNSRVVIDANTAYQITVSDPDDANRAQLTANPTYTPARILITSIGYGPRGAVKQMRMVVRKGAFDFDPPSTLTLTGNVTNFNLGNSNAKGYTGVDQADPTKTKPMFGFTDPISQTTVNTTTYSPLCTTTYCNKAREGTSDPATATLANSDLPSWLRTADAARAFLNDMQSQASAEGRYFPTKSGTAAPSLGTSADPKFTFVDGDLSTASSGAGLLIVTGNLTFSGSFTFDGVVLVMGSWKDTAGLLYGGKLTRSGGGEGLITGALVVSHFDRTTNGGFLPTSFDTSGGGTSDIKFNSLSVANALNSLGSRVIGVTEF
jgi:Tfp pilus assembly protein PilX